MNFETKEITYFKKPGKENTDKTLELAIKVAKENNIKKIVVATYSGETAIKLVEKSKDFEVIAVTLHAGASKKERVESFDKNLEKLESLGIKGVRATQTLSGVERGMHKRYGGWFPLMIFVDTLKLFSEGIKVCVETTLMAADAGLVSPDEDIIAIAGTGGGADAAVLMQPAYSSSVFDLGIKEIICIPKQVGVLHAPR